MQTSRALKATGLVLTAVLLGMLTVQGSYALWNKAGSSNAGTIQAADFLVSLTDTDARSIPNVTQADGTSATLSLSTKPAAVLIPGKSTYAGVQVGNVTNAGGNFTIKATTATPVIDSAVPALASSLSVKTVTATSLAQCSEPALYTNAGAAGTAAVNIDKGLSGVFCFQVTLAATADFGGQTAGITIPITVTQIQEGNP